MSPLLKPVMMIAKPKTTRPMRPSPDSLTSVGGADGSTVPGDRIWPRPIARKNNIPGRKATQAYFSYAFSVLTADTFTGL